MVYAFCRGVELELFSEALLPDEKGLQQLSHTGRFDRGDQIQELLIHLVGVSLRAWEEIGRIVLPLPRQPKPLDIELAVAIENNDLPRHLDIVQFLVLVNAQGARIPDLPVQTACLILKYQRLIGFAVLGCRLGLLAAEIDLIDVVSLGQLLDILHLFSVLSVLGAAHICFIIIADNPANIV